MLSAPALSVRLMKSAGPVLVTRHGKPAGVITGFRTEADYLDWKIENDPRFRGMMESSLARKAAGNAEDLTATWLFRI